VFHFFVEIRISFFDKRLPKKWHEIG